MEPNAIIPPYTAHNGETYPRPPGATVDHLPVWHRFIDAGTGDKAEHISHWIIDPGMFGYLNQTHPLDNDGQYIGAEQAVCFCCGHPVVSFNMTPYRREGVLLFVRCDDDPDYQEPNRTN